MTFQARRYPKSRYTLRLTWQNYDFLYRLSVKWDTSIASVVNRLIAEAQSDITNCKPLTERTQ